MMQKVISQHQRPSLELILNFLNSIDLLRKGSQTLGKFRIGMHEPPTRYPKR